PEGPSGCPRGPRAPRRARRGPRGARPRPSGRRPPCRRRAPTGRGRARRGSPWRWSCRGRRAAPWRSRASRGRDAAPPAGRRAPPRRRATSCPRRSPRPTASRCRTAPRARSRATSDRAASGGRRRRSRRCRACAADSIRRVPGVHVYAVTMAGSEWSSAIAVAAFVASYVGLGLGRVPPFRVDRTGIALLGVPALVVLEVTRQLELPPVPYRLALATAANVGSVATLTANPQNMLVGSFSEVSYRRFLAREAPVAVLGLGCVFLVVWVVYRRQLPQAPLAIVPDTRLAVHYPLMLKTVVAIAVMLVAFLAGVPIAIVAIAGAGCTLLTRRVKPAKVYREVNWALRL